MKITIEATPAEVAGLIVALRDQPDKDMVSEAEKAARAMFDIFAKLGSL